MIRVHIEERDYGNEISVWVLDERPNERWLARVAKDGRFAWDAYAVADEPGPPTITINRRIVGEFFGALEGYRDRNETAEAVLRDALGDAREVRDRLLKFVEGS